MGGMSGCVDGYMGGWVDELMSYWFMRFIEFMSLLSFYY
jgi:ABC-type dipeptide/oligopeptide/nickel transport system permease subunit